MEHKTIDQVKAISKRQPYVMNAADRLLLEDAERKVSNAKQLQAEQTAAELHQEKEMSGQRVAS
ncbi:MAG: hypothetical protein RIC14_05425 [Filomicrobium sp.]